MTETLILAQLVTIGGTILGCAAIVAAFAASFIGELRRVPATGWQPGPWYPPTPAADAWTLPLGKTPAQIEAELSALAVMIPDRPAEPGYCRKRQ